MLRRLYPSVSAEQTFADLWHLPELREAGQAEEPSESALPDNALTAAPDAPRPHPGHPDPRGPLQGQLRRRGAGARLRSDEDGAGGLEAI